MNSDTANRLSEVIAIATKSRATKVKIDGIEVELDASAFAPIEPAVPPKEAKPLGVDIGASTPEYDPHGMCQCGCENAGHNAAGCGSGCPPEKCMGIKSDGHTVQAGQYG